ncbi:hypothetical protein ILUMI_06984 [Ignelater luminosus]|uniref:Transcription factor cwo n=1 Tax=Ignelater luminosus TaxID=2038154 RepID=A0A8K0DA45_IGNLU|nr:hypothetical protein ILUMI_06984 [Ignelater luminosus]
MDMSQSHIFWEENSSIQHVKYESSNSNDEHPRLKDEKTMYTCCDGNLNFATAPYSEDESEYGNPSYKKSKVSRQDPMSHRIIEKRRRDRMNNCLADLSRLIPAEYLKKGRGRIEKTEIIEMAIKYMKHLQQLHATPNEHYRLGYQECMSEAMRFLVEVEGHFPREAICVRLLSHLQKHCEALSRAPIKEHPPSEPYSEDPGQMASVVTPVSQDKIQTQDYLEVNNKREHEPNNNIYPPADEIARNYSEFDTYDKQSDSNGSISYKYKNDIKLRFSQDLNTAAKKQKIENGLQNHNNLRRTSVTSIENQSSSRSSPPSSSGEICTRISSESDVARDSFRASIPRTYHFKTDANVLPTRQSPILNGNHLPADIKNNFSVPIFVLHAKGSFYVPLTIDYYTLIPFLQNYNLLEMFPNLHNVVLHPVTINVNFQPNGGVKYKTELVHNTWH